MGGTLGKRAECNVGNHVYGEPRNVGAGIVRVACLGCGAVHLEMVELDGEAEDRLNGLFSTSQRHTLFSPIVEYAALYGENLIIDDRRFGQSEAAGQRLVRAS